MRDKTLIFLFSEQTFLKVNFNNSNIYFLMFENETTQLSN